MSALSVRHHKESAYKYTDLLPVTWISRCPSEMSKETDGECGSGIFTGWPWPSNDVAALKAVKC